MKKLVPFLILALLSQPIPAGESGDAGRITRSYDLGFLTSEIPQFPAEDWPGAGTLSFRDQDREQEDSAGGGLTLAFGLDESLTAGSGISPDAIILLIRTNIAEDSWANRKNVIQVQKNRLLVTQTEDVHRQIEKLLASLRARRARMVAVEVVFVPAEALGNLLAEQPYRLPEGTLPGILARAGNRGRRISLTAYNDQTVSALSGRHRTTLIDTEVNQTGVLPVSNPVLARLPLGLTAEVRPRVVEATGFIQLNLRISVLRVDGQVEKRETFFSEIEHVPLAEETLGTTLLVEPGQVHLAGVFEERGTEESRRTFAVLVRARPADVRKEGNDEKKDGKDEKGGAAGIGEPFQLRAHDVGFLLDTDGDESTAMDEEVLLAWIRANVDPDSWRDERADLDIVENLLLVTAREPTHEKVRAWLRERAGERGRMVRVTIRELQGPVEAILEILKSAGPDLALPEDWSGGEPAGRLKTVFRGTSFSILGSRTRATGFRARNYVADLSLASGGTGFSVVRMPDPIVRSAGSGFQVSIVAREAISGDRLLLDAGLERCFTGFGRSAEFLAQAEVGPTAAAAPGPAGGEEDAPPGRHLVWIPYRLELPSQAQRRAAFRDPFPLNRDGIILARKTSGTAGRLVLARAVLFKLQGEGR